MVYWKNNIDNYKKELTNLLIEGLPFFEIEKNEEFTNNLLKELNELDNNLERKGEILEFLLIPNVESK